MKRWRPNLGDFFDLDDEHVRTEYLKRKAARLAGGKVDGIPHVIHRADLSTSTYQIFTVRGDTDPSNPYTVWLAPNRRPWAAACSRGGVHDNQRPGEACSHGLAAAVAWALMTLQPCKNCSEPYDPNDRSDPDYGAFVGPRYCGHCGADEARMLAVDLGVDA